MELRGVKRKRDVVYYLQGNANPAMRQRLELRNMDLSSFPFQEISPQVAVASPTLEQDTLDQ